MTRKAKYDFYDDWFKATAVELGALPGVYVTDVAEVLDIHPVMLYRWKKEYRDGDIMKKTLKTNLDSEMRKELKRLKKIEKAHKTLQMEHELLKKSIQYCSVCPPRMAMSNNPDAPELADCFFSFVEELGADQDKIALYRERLSDLSWLMRFLNEHIARKANREDQVKGRFWEGRFKTQALLDEGAVLACMAYVDLNPIRAGIAETPEQSDYTSVKERIDSRETASKSLSSFNSVKHQTPSIHTAQINSIALTDYLALIDWTGRQIRLGKTGRIASDLEPILSRLNLDTNHWIGTVSHFGEQFGIAAGHWDRIKQKARETGRHWLHGMGVSRKAYRLTLS